MWLWEYWILATRPVTSDKTLALPLCRNEFPQRQKVVKHIKSLLGGKNVPVSRHTQADSERIMPSCALNHLYGAFLLGFLDKSPCFAWFWACIWFLLGSSLVLDSSEEAYGEADITHFLTSIEPFYACTVRKVSLTLRMRNTWGLSFNWAELSSSSSSSWSICPEGTNSSLGPIYLLPKNQYEEMFYILFFSPIKIFHTLYSSNP